jgi:hypothetical protein
MMKFDRALRLALFLAPLVSGCANNLAVTYYSDPPGAVLYAGERRVGYTPQVLYYQVTEDDMKKGTKSLQGTRVVWTSGATASIPNLNANIVNNGKNHSYTFLRPNVPGRETDAKFALELDKVKIMQQTADAASQAAANSNVDLGTTCTTSRIGDVVRTSCH